MKSLTAPDKFFAALRASGLLGPTLDQGEVDGTNALLTACGSANWGPKWTAYALATAYHETAATMEPIMERGGRGYFTAKYDVQGDNPARARRYGNTTPGDGPRYCGRGYVQLTWKLNYARFEGLLGVPLLDDPNLAMQPDIAAKIMIIGMRDGVFTGKRLGDYITTTNADWVGARRVINGVDKAAKIAEYAQKFHAMLLAGGWR